MRRRSGGRVRVRGVVVGEGRGREERDGGDGAATAAELGVAGTRRQRNLRLGGAARCGWDSAELGVVVRWWSAKCS